MNYNKSEEKIKINRIVPNAQQTFLSYIKYDMGGLCVPCNTQFLTQAWWLELWKLFLPTVSLPAQLGYWKRSRDIFYRCVRGGDFLDFLPNVIKCPDSLVQALCRNHWPMQYFLYYHNPLFSFTWLSESGILYWWGDWKGKIEYISAAECRNDQLHKEYVTALHLIYFILWRRLYSKNGNLR